MDFSKQTLEELVENRQYCVLCPIKDNPETFKTKGALKFHIRIKHHYKIEEKLQNEPSKSAIEGSEPARTTTMTSFFGQQLTDRPVTNKADGSEEEDWSLVLESDEDDPIECPESQESSTKNMIELVRESRNAIEEVKEISLKGGFIFRL